VLVLLVSKNYFMKKFIISALMLIITGGSFASGSQEFTNRQTGGLNSCTLPVMFTDRKDFNESILYWAALESRAVSGNFLPDVKDVKARALSDFQIRFQDVTSVQWFSDHNGYTSYFTKDGLSNRVFYDKNGRWMYSVLFKTEDKLPKDVRASIKSVYYDWKINVIEEVQSVEGKGYLVYLEDKANIQILRVNKDKDIEIMMEMVKQ
jgi:hypothetical protein